MTNNPPIRPQLAASVAIFRGSRVLLVRRAREPGRGRYSLPGGRVEWGETVEQAVHREVAEETGLVIDILAPAGLREVLPVNGGGHFVVLSYAARWLSGDVMLNDELDDHVWVAPEQVVDFPLTEGLMPILDAARLVVGA